MDDIRKAFFGRLADYSEETIKRMIMRLLINKVVKEKFNSFRVEQTILVYMIPGRRIDMFKEGKIRIIMTDSVEKEEEDMLKKAKLQEDKQLMNKHIPDSQTSKTASKSQKGS